ncbi:MAG: hypothetical protein WAK33_24225, partial [Silvibacterium sp.]
MRIVPASLLAVLAATVLIANLGCGSRASNTVTTNPPPGADFSLTVSPATLSLMAGTTGQVVAVTANALNGFTA